MMEGNFNNLLLNHGRGPKPLTAPPELPIRRGVVLHMRSGPFGIWAAITTHEGANFAADYSPSPARSYTRARPTLRSTEPVPDAYIGVNTAFTLLPWGNIDQGAPEKFLMWITAVGGYRDPDGAEMHPGDAYILNLPRKVAQQYYYDWGRHRRTPPISRPPPPGATYPLGQWEQMAMNLIPRPYTMTAPTGSSSSQAQPAAATSSSSGTQPAPTTGPTPAPSPRPSPSPPSPPQQPRAEPDHPSMMQQHPAQTSHAAGSDEPVGTTTRGAQPQEVAMMLQWLRELAAWASEQALPMQVRYELESAIAVMGDYLHHARRQHSDGPTRGTKRREANQILAARLRLLDIGDDEAEDLNQHQTFEDLRTIEKLLREGEQQFRSATQGKGGNMLRQGEEGVQQALAAIRQAQAETVEGELDWCTSGWGAAVAVLLEEAQDAIAEVADLNYVHASDVVGLAQGGEECPCRPPEPKQRLEAILGDIRAALGFVTAGPHSQVLNVLAALDIWALLEPLPPGWQRGEDFTQGLHPLTDVFDDLHKEHYNTDAFNDEPNNEEDNEVPDDFQVAASLRQSGEGPSNNAEEACDKGELEGTVEHPSFGDDEAPTSPRSSSHVDPEAPTASERPEQITKGSTP